MNIDETHPEDIKAALRKQYGSVVAFERAKKLPHKSVSDWLRGRKSRRVRDTIEATLSPGKSDKVDASAKKAQAHRQNAASAA